MIVPRVVIIGDVAEAFRWIGAAKQYAVQTFKARISHKMYKFGGVTIRVKNVFSPTINSGIGVEQISGGICKVFIESSGDKFTYQFFGTLDYVYKDYFDVENYGLSRSFIRGYLTVVTTTVDAADEYKLLLKSTPLLSNVEYLNENGRPVWAANVSPMPDVVHQFSMVKPFHQPDSFGAYYQYTNNSAGINPWVLSQWAAASPCHALYFNSGSNSVISSYVDVGYDFSPSVFRRKSGVDQVPDADFYQRAVLVRIANEQYGGRMFVIMYDATHRFYCYPVGVREIEYIDTISYRGIKTNVEDRYVKSQACPWPEWVNLEAWGRAAGENPDPPIAMRRLPVWQFSADGLKAACVVSHRDSAWEDGLYTSASLFSSTGEERWKIQEDYPGMVEVLFAISITGSNEEDFTFTIELGTTSYSKTDSILPIAVGYALRDLPLDQETKTVRANQLIRLTYQHYLSPTYMTQEALIPHNDLPNLNEFVHPCFATVAVVSVNSESGWTELTRWLAWYSCLGNASIDAINSDRPFFPKLEEFTELSGDVGDFVYDMNDYSFITNIQTMELSTLSWSLGATLRTSGRKTGDGVYRTYGAQAATVIVNAFGEEKIRESVGHPLLVSEIARLFGLTGDYPNLSQLTELDVNATARYEFFIPEGQTYYSEPQYDENTRFTKLHISNGENNSPEEGIIIQNAGDGLFYTLGSNSYFELNENFVDAVAVRSPMIYRFFDYKEELRPGLVWWTRPDSEYLYQPPGRMEFSGFPFGAAHHAKVAGATLVALNNRHGQIRICKNGSWSIFFGPFSAHTNLQQFLEGSNYVTPSLDDIQQKIIDRVHIREEPKNGNIAKEGESTHLALVNSAFRKDLVDSDFFFDFRLYNSWNSIVQMRPKGQYPEPTPWFQFYDNSDRFAGAVSPAWVTPLLYFGNEVIWNCFGLDFTNYSEADGVSFFQSMCHPSLSMESVFGV